MPGVVPSEELRALLPRVYRALERADRQALLELFSSEPHLLLIGSDAQEWVSGREVVQVFIAQVEEMAGLAIEPGEVVAWSNESAGWVADEPRLVLPNGREVRPRVTAVLVIERGHWRIVQWHMSIPQPNEDALGYSLTTSLESIEQYVREDRPDVSPGSAPDGTVTILFSDIESSTVLLERLGDTEFLALLAWHDRIVRETAERHRGFVVKSQGDGFMLAFPSAAFALRSALSMREQIRAGYGDLPVRIRVGLHAGEAIRLEDDFYGRTVVIAARISALALGDEILASGLVHELARGLGTFTFGPARTSILKGLAGDFTVHPLLG